MSLRHPRTRFLAAALAAAVGAMLWAAALTSAASAAPSWVRIDGKPELRTAKKLRYRIYCRDACKVEVTARIAWPKRPALVNRLRGHLRAGESRSNIITLNKVALNVLRANFRRSRLRVLVRATNRKTGRQATVRRNFRFTSTS